MARRWNEHKRARSRAEFLSESGGRGTAGTSFYRKCWTCHKSGIAIQVSQLVPNTKPCILVVEDEALIRLSAMELVECEGYEVIGVSNADEAVRVLEQHEGIRAVFSDIQCQVPWTVSPSVIS